MHRGSPDLPDGGVLRTEDKEARPPPMKRRRRRRRHACLQSVGYVGVNV